MERNLLRLYQQEMDLILRSMAMIPILLRAVLCRQSKRRQSTVDDRRFCQHGRSRTHGHNRSAR